MRVLVSGAGGFLGTHLVPRLLSDGHCVACLRRAGSVGPVPDQAVTWNIDEAGGGVREALAAFAPDVVVHLAARFVAEHRYEDIGPLVRANVEFGAYLLDAMQASACAALVYAGTSWQHYHGDTYCPANFYAATKQAFSTLSDYYRDAASLRMLELHLYDCYGNNDPRQKLLGLLERSANSEESLAISAGEQRVHLVHVDDVARGFAMACEQVRTFAAGERRIYRLPAERALSLKEVVAAFDDANPARPARVHWRARAYRQREVFQPWEDADVLPGWQPRISLADGLRQLRQEAASSP